MRHPDEGTIHAWLDGALDDAEAASLESHARECAACGALVAEARGLVAGASRVLGALDLVPGGVIPHQAEPVGAGSGAQGIPRTGAPDESTSSRAIRREAMRAQMRQRPRWAVPARAAAALLLVAGGTFVVMRSTSGPYLASPEVALVRDTDASVVVPAISAQQAVPAAEVGASANDVARASAPAPQAPRAAAPATAQAPVAAGLAPAPTRAAARDAARGDVSRGNALRSDSATRALREEGFIAAARAALQRRDAQRRVDAPLALRSAPDSLRAPTAEAVVVGVVRDEHTGEPVAGASILFDNGDIGTLTDQLGRFAITGTTTGVHRAQVRRMGYTTMVREVAVAGDSSVLDVQLTPASGSIAAALGPGYTPVERGDRAAGAASGASANAASGASANAGARQREKTARVAEAAAPTEAAATSIPQQPKGGARPRDEVLDSVTVERATSDNPGVTTTPAVPPALAPGARRTQPDPVAVGALSGPVDMPLATRAPARPKALRNVQRDAAGQCLSIALSPYGERNVAPARTIAVRLLATVRKDAGDSSEFALEFPHAGDVAAGALGGWKVVPRSSESARDATTVRLRWTAGGEVVRVDLDWAHQKPDGRASLRQGGVGVDARATATRVECRTVR